MTGLVFLGVCFESGGTGFKNFNFGSFQLVTFVAVCCFVFLPAFILLFCRWLCNISDSLRG